MLITKGFKYRIYPNKEQISLINHQCFIYNQSYNICLNLQQEQWHKNKDLPKKDRTYMKASQIDEIVKSILKQRNLSYKSVTTQQARINANRALQQALTDKTKGFPKFKNSKFAKQSFNWNNQGYQIKDSPNTKFKIFRLMNTPLKMCYHRELPKSYKLNQITISKSHNKYYVSLSITYDNNIIQRDTRDTIENIDTININKAIGIDLNINNIALSNGNLINTNSKFFSYAKYDKAFKRLQRKQSRRILISKSNNIKLSSNFKKTQNKLNKIYERSSNIKCDYYQKITTALSVEFDLIVVEDLQTKNMTKRAKLKNIKAKSGLNKSILNTSFYQFTKMLEYKQMHNGKFFLKINPQYTSKACNICGNIKDNLTLKDRIYVCEVCGNTIHRDINASMNILERGLESSGLGTTLLDYKQKAFRVS